MALSAAALLDAIDLVIQARLNGGAYESYSEGAERWQGASLNALMAERRQLVQQVALEANGGHYLFQPLAE